MTKYLAVINSNSWGSGMKLQDALLQAMRHGGYRRPTEFKYFQYEDGDMWINNMGQVVFDDDTNLLFESDWLGLRHEFVDAYLEMEFQFFEMINAIDDEQDGIPY